MMSSAENEQEKRAVSQLGYLPPEILDHLEKAVRRKNFKEEKNLENPFGMPPEKVYPYVQNPADAKAMCTSYPGRVVCHQGLYTFVINNGEHKMDPEVIERFAAMIYHRSQEGDSNFEVSVDVPVNINEDYFGTPQKSDVEPTTCNTEGLRFPVYIECSPVLGNRKMYNGGNSRTEVIYSCRQNKFGIEDNGEIEKQMVITVDNVSTGNLVLPYNTLLERRLKRQKDKQLEKPEISDLTGNAYWTTHGLHNILYSDVGSFQKKSWCPNIKWSKFPEASVTVAMKENISSNSNDATAAPSQVVVQMNPEQPPALNMGSLRPLPPGNSVNTQEVIPNITQSSLSAWDPGAIASSQIKDPGFFSDRMTIDAWRPPSFRLTKCTLNSCVKLQEYATPANGIESRKRKRQVQQLEKKLSYPMSRHRQNKMGIRRKFRQKRIYARNRREQVSSMGTTSSPLRISCILCCKPDTTPNCETQPTTECGNLPIWGRKRKLKKTNHIQWSDTSKERYILE